MVETPATRAGGITVLDIGRVRLKAQTAPVGIEQGMALAAFDLLAGIIAPWPAAFSGFDAMAVDHAGKR